MNGLSELAGIGGFRGLDKNLAEAKLPVFGEPGGATCRRNRVGDTYLAAGESNARALRLCVGAGGPELAGLHRGLESLHLNLDNDSLRS